MKAKLSHMDKKMQLIEETQSNNLVQLEKKVETELHTFEQIKEYNKKHKNKMAD